MLQVNSNPDLNFFHLPSKMAFLNRQFSKMNSVKRSALHAFDGEGREVLIGLTFEETIEFAILDAVPPKADGIQWQAVAASFPQAEARWLELFEKHSAAVKMREEK